MPVAAVWAVATGREVAHTHRNDANAARVPKYDNQADIHGMWETLAPPAADGNIPKPVFAKGLVGGLPESESESARSSWGGARDMSCANFVVGHTGARALDVE